MIDYQKTFKWNDEELKFERPSLAAMYGQHIFGDLIVEVEVTDVRLKEDGDDSVPWDAAAVVEGNHLILIGYSGPGGGGTPKASVMPMDVELTLHVWTQSR